MLGLLKHLFYIAILLTIVIGGSIVASKYVDINIDSNTKICTATPEFYMTCPK